MSGMEWQCPHCNHFVTITDERFSSSTHYLDIDNSIGKVAFESAFLVCPNPSCRKFTLQASTREWAWVAGPRRLGKTLRSWRLYPEGSARPFPDYIPEVIRSDYLEACLIADLSPKASATLSRRCLQGILRDYWKVRPGNLINEIEQIKDKTDAVTWNAIDAVRKIGNIGAHMEKDINIIVDVDPNEAALLISLVETLLAEWYVGTHEREQRMQAIVAAAEAKKPPKAAQ